MDLRPADLIGGFYQDDSLPWTAQDTLNWLPEAAEASGTRTPTMLRQAPGLRPYVQVGEGPIRGIRNVEGKLLVVSGNQLYQVTTAGVAIPRGTIPGVGPVSMSHNQRGTTNQLLIVNGSAGYVYDTSALTLTKVTDPGYPGAFVVDFVDGYLAQVEPRRRYWFHSALRDALEYNTLDRYDAEGQPDALVTLLVDHREVWVFGERTIEPYVNTGALTNTFQRASNTVIEVGCSAKFSPAKLDNSVFWLDELGIVRQSQGYTARRISTGPIERAIADLDWSRAFGFTMTEKGHAIYYLTFPDGYTFGYDIVTGLWHRRASYNLDRWRVSCVAYWQDQYVAGDFQQGLLYVVDWEYPRDGVLPNVRKRVTGVTHNNQNRVLIPYAEIIAQTGEKIVAVENAAAQPTGPTITGDAPSGAAGFAYSYSYTLGGGTPPYVVSLRSGTLPAGITLSSAGVLSGTPTATGTSTFTVRVTDSTGLYADLADTLPVSSALMLATNTRFYTGAPASLSLQAGNYGFTSAKNRIRLSPTGQYVAGINSSAGADRLEISKYDPGTGTWSLLAGVPATLPVGGGRDLAWHPSGDYLAVSSIGTTALDSLKIYKRVGDAFTPIADPADPLAYSATTLAWDSVGARIAIQTSFSGERIVFYAFDETTDTLGTRTNTGSLGANDQDFLRLNFQSGSGSLYMVGSGPARTVVFAVTEGPIRVAATASGAAGVGCFFTANNDYVVVVGNGDLGVAEGRIFAFDDTLSSESLTLSSDFADQPSGVPIDASISPDKQYLAIGQDAGNSPQIYDLGTAAVPVATKLTDPATTGATVSLVSWGALYE